MVSTVDSQATNCEFKSRWNKILFWHNYNVKAANQKICILPIFQANLFLCLNIPPPPPPPLPTKSESVYLLHIIFVLEKQLHGPVVGLLDDVAHLRVYQLCRLLTVGLVKHHLPWLRHVKRQISHLLVHAEVHHLQKTPYTVKHHLPWLRHVERQLSHTEDTIYSQTPSPLAEACRTTAVPYTRHHIQSNTISPGRGMSNDSCPIQKTPYTVKHHLPWLRHVERQLSHTEDTIYSQTPSPLADACWTTAVPASRSCRSAPPTEDATYSPSHHYMATFKVVVHYTC